MIISHVKIIAFQLSLFCKNYRFSKPVLYIINRKIHGCLEIPDLFRVWNMISLSIAVLLIFEQQNITVFCLSASGNKIVRHKSCLTTEIFRDY
jgi:hypothetical protein